MNTKNAGFTLIEVLIVIAIIGIAAGIGVPTFLKMLPNWRTKAATTDLFSNLQLAKLTAIRKGQDCVVTFTGNPASKNCQYQISIINKTVSLADYGSDVVFRGPNPEFRRWDPNPSDPDPSNFRMTFTSRGILDTDDNDDNSGFVYFSSDKIPLAERVHYRAGASTAGVVQMQRYEGAIWR